MIEKEVGVSLKEKRKTVKREVRNLRCRITFHSYSLHSRLLHRFSQYCNLPPPEGASKKLNNQEVFILQSFPIF